MHFRQQRFVRKPHRAAQRVAQQLTAELPHERIAPGVRQIVLQAGKALDRRAIGKLRSRIDRLIAQVFLAILADCVEILQSKPIRIDPRVANGTLRIAYMLFHQLSHGKFVTFRSIVRQWRHALGWLRQTLAQQHFANPNASKNGARARCSRLLRQRGGLCQHAATRVLSHAVYPSPFLALHTGDTIVFRQLVIQVGIVGQQDIQYRGVIVEQVREELNRLFVHRLT